MGSFNNLPSLSRISPPLDTGGGAQEIHSAAIPPESPASLESGEQRLQSDDALVADSHARCRRTGIDSRWTRPRQRLSPDTFRSITQQYSGLISYAHLLFTELHQSISASHSVFALTTASGHVIHLHSCPEMMARAINHCGIGPGASLAEESCGTTAVAIALRHHRAAALRAEQHYCTLFRECCSVACPVDGWDGTTSACAAIFSRAEDPFGEKIALARCIAKELSQFCLDSPAQSGNECSRSPQKPPEVPAPIELTARQLRVLGLFAEGQSYKQIARTLGLASIKTVEEHLDAVRSKMGVTHRRQCIQRATELGLLGHHSAFPVKQ